MPTKNPIDPVIEMPIDMPAVIDVRSDVAMAGEQIEATTADGERLNSIPQYEVLERLVHDGVDYPVGATVELSEERAAALTRAGVVRKVEAAP